jgi:hypothetical protein
VQAPTKYELVINLKTAKASASKSHPPCSPRRRGDRVNQSPGACVMLHLLMAAPGPKAKPAHVRLHVGYWGMSGTVTSGTNPSLLADSVEEVGQ